ncbi:F-box/kelch-repeat protein At3g06240-like [Papaver somniferum]|uniref:F-box/kelch-repeat protein At3g06240-like n=1 Tax=Papaver somniferum TaxID=3469 RepID=UPI000E6FEB35|nr:F-box/kelch-repeat protein At3g06240-like [Papaver somniferum]XP_026420654.1 F-box/kelch-repeat protein At3g06240-like [Papaver somniferum]
MDSFNLLPEEVMSDILTHLPTESVLDCKLVSKTWKNLIQHPLFSKMHTNRLVNHSATACSTDSCKLGFLASTCEGRLYYFGYIENRQTQIRRINLKPPFHYDTFVGSFNGLICLAGREGSVCIYNPMTKEYVILPQPKIKFCKYDSRWIGFGYLVSTNEYKVVQVNELEKEPNFVEVVVYTLGSGNGWRNIGKFELGSNHVFFGGYGVNSWQCRGVFADGALHWIHRIQRIIMVFDLADEKFRQHLASPPFPRVSSSNIGGFGGTLFYAHKCYDPITKDYMCTDFWLYKEKNDRYGHHSLGRSREFTAECSVPLALTKNGDVLSCDFDCLNIYDRKTFTPKKLVDVNDIFFSYILSHARTR